VMSLLRLDDLAGRANLWRLLAQATSTISLGETPGEYYGGACYPQNWTRQGFLYLAGIAWPEAAFVLQPPLALQSLPAGPYVRFIHRGSESELQFTRDYIYHTWLPHSGRSLLHPLEVEVFSGGLPAQDGAEGECFLYLPLA